MSETKEDAVGRRARPALGQIFATGVETPINPRRLRELAIWYRALAERAGNPAIWEARLRTAEELDAEANRIEQQQGAPQ